MTAVLHEEEHWLVEDRIRLVQEIWDRLEDRATNRNSPMNSGPNSTDG